MTSRNLLRLWLRKSLSKKKSRTFLRNASADPDQIGWTDRLVRYVAEATVALGNLFGNSEGEPDQITGAAGLAIMVAIVTVALGLLPAIFLRERMRNLASAKGSKETSV